MIKKGSQSKKLFTRSEVEEYVKKMLTSSEVTMCEQKDRILELKRELEEAERQNNELQEKIKLIKKALSESERANRQAKKDSSIQTKLVVSKVQQFGYKWKSFFRELFEEVKELRGNASYELFGRDVDELVSAVIEAGNPRDSLDDSIIPISGEVGISEEEWLRKKLKSMTGEVKYTLSETNEDKYKQIMERLKGQMIYTAELNQESTSFDIHEALNPKDSLETIMKDLK